MAKQQGNSMNNCKDGDSMVQQIKKQCGKGRAVAINPNKKQATIVKAK